jgi:hypothetical protein
MICLAAKFNNVALRVSGLAGGCDDLVRSNVQVVEGLAARNLRGSSPEILVSLLAAFWVGLYGIKLTNLPRGLYSVARRGLCSGNLCGPHPGHTGLNTF